MVERCLVPEADAYLALPEAQSFTVTQADGFAIRCQGALAGRREPSVVVVLPFGVPNAVARSAFRCLGPKYNVVTWEARYILDSAAPFSGVEALSPDVQVDDLLSVLDALGIDRCCLVGFCSGAGIALVAATEHPDRFTDVILVSGEYQLFRHGHRATPYERSVDGFLPIVAQSRAQATAVFSKMADLGKAARGVQSDLQKQINVPFTDAEYLFRYAKTYMAYRDFDAVAVAPNVTQPTFVVAGALDEHTRVENSQVVAARIPRSTVFIDDVADHYGFCVADSKVLGAIGSYLGV